MIRHRAACKHCAFASDWNRDRERSQRQVKVHLAQAHDIASPADGADYSIAAERQCDYCQGPYLDDCTKCRRDFCHLHAGDIDGLCGGCI